MDYFHGFDLSLTGTGVVVLDANLNVVHKETLKNKLRGCERLSHIRNKLDALIVQYPPSVVCIEDYIKHLEVGQAFHIGELGGVIKTELWEREIDPVLISPTMLKKFITGKGIAEKDMVVLSVYKHFGFEADDNDQADAYGLARLAHALGTGNTYGFMMQQLEVIHTVHNPPPPKKNKRNKNAKPKEPKLCKKPLKRRTANAN